MACRVELINIGTELLMGFVINTHAAYLGQKLNKILLGGIASTNSMDNLYAVVLAGD